MGAQGAQPVNVVQPQPRADGRAPGHQHPAAGLDQLLAQHQILGAIGEHLEAVLGQRPRRLDQPERVRLQRIGVADHFQLDPGSIEQLARHLCRGHRLARRIAARRVRQ